MKKTQKVKQKVDVDAVKQEEMVFEAILVPAQLLKQLVKLNITEGKGNGPHESPLTFNRNILPADFDWGDGVTFKMVITKIAKSVAEPEAAKDTEPATTVAPKNGEIVAN